MPTELALSNTTNGISEKDQQWANSTKSFI